MNKKIYLLLLVILSSMILWGAGCARPGGTGNEGGKKEIIKKVFKIQIPFIVNQGQTDERIRFYTNTFGGSVFITKDGEIFYYFRDVEEKGLALKEELVGGKVEELKGEGEAITRISYFRENDPAKWKRSIPTYDLVSLGEVYKGVELKLRAYGDNVEKLFYVKPGAEPEAIRVKLSGARALRVNRKGGLEVETELGTVEFTRPVAYQRKGRKKEFLEVAYVVKNNEYGFKLGDYDRTRGLVIDPLLASTFLGGSDWDFGQAIAIDSGGNVYVAGETSNFPTTTGAFDTTPNGTGDVFVSKLNGNLTNLLASTYLGGSRSDGDYASSIAIDSGGDVYVAGHTYSSDFPTTTGAFDISFNGGLIDIFVSKLNGNLTNLLASTYLGGSSYDYARSIAIDAHGNVYLAGTTLSSDFPTTTGAFDTTPNGGYDGFVAKLNSNLTNLLASTYLGGSSYDSASSIAIDSDGNVYVAGYTDPLSPSSFPTTTGAFDTTPNGGYDVFVSKLSPSLSQTDPTGSWIRIVSDKSSYSVGDTLNVLVSIANPGSAIPVDIYFAIQLPNGSLYSYIPNLDNVYDGNFSPVDTSDLTTLRPAFRNITLPPGFTPSDFTIFKLTFSQRIGLPQGNYTWYAALAEPGTLNFLGKISSATFSYRP